MRLLKGVSSVCQMVECFSAGKVGHQGWARRAQSGSNCACFVGAESGVFAATGDPGEIEDRDRFHSNVGVGDDILQIADSLPTRWSK